MKLILTLQEKTELLTTAFQYFAESLQCWEHQIDYENKDYKNAQVKLIKKRQSSLCREDVFACIVLKGKGIKIIDCEDEDNVVVFNAALFNKNLPKCDPMEVIKLLDDNGDYDYYTTDSILQTLIFGEVIYG